MAKQSKAGAGRGKLKAGVQGQSPGRVPGAKPPKNCTL